MEFVNKAKGPVGDAVRSSFDFAPDFSGDWAKRDRLLERCAGAVEEPEAVSAWINGVYNKLLTWKPKRALEFKPDPPSSTMRISDLGASAAASLLKDFKTEINHSRRSLTEYGQRLADILYVEGKL